MFELFDRFLLLCHGEVVFHGAAHHAVPYLSRHNYVMPEHWNPSDFMLDLTSSHTATWLEETEAMRELTPLPNLDQEQRSSLIQSWSNSEEKEQLIKDIDDADAKTFYNLTTIKRKIVNDKKTSGCCCGFSEVLNLFQRQHRSNIRNPITIIIAVLMQLMQVVVFGKLGGQCSNVRIFD